MSDFRFIGRYSIANVDFIVINGSGTQVDADAPPVVEYRNYATNVPVWSRTTSRLSTGLYRVTISSAESGIPGLFYLLWNYNISATPQQYRTDIEVPSSTSTLYNVLSDQYQAVVDNAWSRFKDLFDSAVGGPHLQMYSQANFGRERVAQLMRIGLNSLNSASQPHSQYSLDAGNDFPFSEWGGLLEQATTVEIIKHLMRSYVEQPEAVGVSVARLDRRDYLQRWQTILDIESAELKEQMSVFKMSQMNLGRGSVLVSGGAYGTLAAYQNPARGRPLPTWVR